MQRYINNSLLQKKVFHFFTLHFSNDAKTRFLLSSWVSLPKLLLPNTLSTRASPQNTPFFITRGNAAILAICALCAGVKIGSNFIFNQLLALIHPLLNVVLCGWICGLILSHEKIPTTEMCGGRVVAAKHHILPI